MIDLINAEIEDDKGNLFEREKFIEASDNISEIIVNLLEQHVYSANAKLKEIEALKEEITNLNFKLEQTISQDASLGMTLERAKLLYNKCREEYEKKIDALGDSINKYDGEIKKTLKDIEELCVEYEAIQKEKSERKKHYDELMEKGIGTIEYYQNAEQIYIANVVLRLF